MRNIAIVLFLLGIVTCRNTPAEDEKTGSAVSLEDAREALDFHNNARNEVGVPPLEWSDELAAYAQEWAEYLVRENNCQLTHRNALDKNPKSAGENIFRGSSAVYTTLSACQAWYGEKSKFDPQGNFQSNYPSSGHYMQMIWRDTKQLGIGIAHCTNGSVIIVASYFPAGNVVGEKPY